MDRWLKLLGCGSLIIVTVIVCLGVLIFGPFWYPTLKGVVVRLQTENVQNWALPSDTKLVDFNIYEIYGAGLTHPELCTYVAILTLESALPKDALIDYYHQFESQGYVAVKEIRQLIGGSIRYDVNFSFFTDVSGYHCDHGFGSIAPTREANQ